MKPESKFVYDWLKTHIEFFEITEISSTVIMSYPNPPTSKATYNSKCFFACRGGKLFDKEVLVLVSPSLIPVKFVYRALIELRGENMNIKLSEDEIARSLGIKSIVDKLKEET
jgi:hypothetical protein